MRVAACLLALTLNALMPAHATEAGRRLYETGLLATGAPVAAAVRGDASPARLACAGCHGRSGFGKAEGGVVTPALTADALFQPLRSGQRRRAAYTEATLARAIREGIDPEGRRLRSPMPTFALDDAQLAPLIAHLRGLSRRRLPPGVDDAEIRFATVITEDVEPHRRDAMLEVLDAYVRDRNAQTRREARRARVPAYQTDVEHRYRLPTAYRRWTLSRWTLTGPGETWPDQLRRYYAEAPVFAVLSGIGNTSWAPVHRFCEERRLPCVFPNTMMPLTGNNDFYTVYFSRGLALEAEAAAKHAAAELAPEARVVQVYRRGDAAGTALAKAFRDYRIGAGHRAPDDIVVEPGAERLAELPAKRPGAVALWLDHETLSALAGAAIAWPERRPVYLSSSLLGDPPAVPAALRDRARLVYPYRLAAGQSRFPREEAWLRRRGVMGGAVAIRAQTLAACMIVAEALMHLDTLVSREYFLERLEHLDSSVLNSVYPGLSLGPGQRFASKGAYILETGGGSAPGAGKSAWIIP